MTFEDGEKTTKRHKLPRSEWVLIERPDLAIVDQTLFHLAERLRNIRKKRYTTIDPTEQSKMAATYFQGVYPFASKIFCKECGGSYHHRYADRAGMIPIYSITHKDCVNLHCRIYEEDITAIVSEALRKTIDSQDSICTHLEDILTKLVKASKPEADKDLAQFKRQKASLEKKMDELIDSLSEGFTETAVQRIKSKINALDHEIIELSAKIEEKESTKIDSDYIESRIKYIHDGIQDLREFKSPDRAQILSYIDKILICKNGSIEIYLQSGHKIVTQDNCFEVDDVEKMFSQDVLYS